MAVELHPDAAAELTAAGDWYDGQVSGLGPDLLDEFDRAVAAIVGSPATWPLWPGVDESMQVRRFWLARFPFAIAFVASGDDVEILAVAHLRRRPGYWASRGP